jgi:hypothetical protein
MGNRCDIFELSRYYDEVNSWRVAMREIKAKEVYNFPLPL